MDKEPWTPRSKYEDARDGALTIAVLLILSGCVYLATEAIAPAAQPLATPEVYSSLPTKGLK